MRKTVNSHLKSAVYSMYARHDEPRAFPNREQNRHTKAVRDHKAMLRLSFTRNPPDTYLSYSCTLHPLSQPDRALAGLLCFPAGVFLLFHSSALLLLLYFPLPHLLLLPFFLLLR